MNKNLMKRKHIEEANILLQKRAQEEKEASHKNPEQIKKNNLRKGFLSDRLMDQLKNKK
jgi:hypothetical protein